MAIRRSGQSATEQLDSRVWRIVAVVFLGPLMTQLDSTVVNVSLSSISHELHASIDSAQWTISGYLLALSFTLPLHAWLVHRFGAKRLYVSCFSAFTLASLLCGMQRTISGLIWARVCQGMVGGLLTPMAQTMLARTAGKHIARVIGYTAVPVLMAPLMGPLVAGMILKHAGWPWLFYINMPIGILAVFLAIFILPSEAGPPRSRPLDWVGFLLIAPVAALLLYGLDHASGRQGRQFLAAGVVLGTVFLWHAARKDADALIDLRLFRNRVFSIGITTQFLANGANYGGQMLVPLFLIAGCGISTAKAGWMLAPMGLGLMCINSMLGFLIEGLGTRTVCVAGTIAAISGTLPFLWMKQSQISPLLVAGCMFTRGAGQGAVFLPSLSAAYLSVSRDQLPLAVAASNIFQRFGGPLGSTIMAIVLSYSATSLSADRHPSFMMGFLALIGFQLILLRSAGRLPARLHSEQASLQGF